MFRSLSGRVNVAGSFSAGSSDNGASDICREYSSASRDGPQVLLFCSVDHLQHCKDV